jgi:uridine kinase
MRPVENEITRQNIERAKNNPELQKNHEIEGKYLPTEPDLFDAYKMDSVPIEQRYLSHPDDEFSLRVRVEYTSEGAVYSTALKGGDEIVDGKLKRSEVDVQISPEAYAFYTRYGQFPALHKLRAKPYRGVAIDFIEGKDRPRIEVEDVPDGEGNAFLGLYEAFLENRSDDPAMLNEVIAHELYQEKYGQETLVPRHETNEHFVNRILRDAVAQYVVTGKPVVIGISGMSGSGKSTAARLLQEKTTEIYGEKMAPAILSTDDYHYGKRYLEETYGAPYGDWDAPQTFNTPLMATMLQRLISGEPIPRQHFDFDLEEVVEDGHIQPGIFTIVEGTYANSPDLDAVRSLHYDMPTAIADSAGRDVRRLVIDSRANRAFPTQEDRLRHVVEVIIPTCIQQQRKLHNSFSAHSRPLPHLTHLLEMLPTDSLAG